MSRTQIKHRREYHQKEIDRLMSAGYGGYDDPAFKRACEQVSIHEEELKKLQAATEEINTKLRNTRNASKLQKLSQERDLKNDRRIC